jgi:hypothetical protein
MAAILGDTNPDPEEVGAPSMALAGGWTRWAVLLPPATHITIRGDGHYGRPQVMAWCEAV